MRSVLSNCKKANLKMIKRSLDIRLTNVNRFADERYPNG